MSPEELQASYFHSLIIRDPYQFRGPGLWTLYQDEEIYAVWPCITGHRQLDERQRGGLTPALVHGMIMTGEIHPHQEPNSPVKNQDHCVLLPIDREEAAESWPRRTWYNDGDRFKIHSVGVDKNGIVTGKSTGCPSVPRPYWERAKDLLNMAFRHSQTHGYQFIVLVRDYQQFSEMLA